MAHQALIAKLPKVDLHCHLDGSPRLATLVELAKQQGGSGESLEQALAPGARRGSLAAYLAVFPRILDLMQNEAAIERIAFELAEDAQRENVRWIEVRYCPSLHQRDGLSGAAVINAVRAGLARAQRTHGIGSGQLITALRHRGPAHSLELAVLASEHAGDGLGAQPGGVIGFDLAGPERDNPAHLHAAAFARARAGNLWTTCHAGEDAGPDSVADAVYACAVARVGHGVALRGQAPLQRALQRYLADHTIGVEACLSSNLQTGAVARLAEHPLPELLAAGVRISLSTDNRLVSHTNVSAEYQLAADTFGLSAAQLRQLARNGIESAFLSRAARASLLAELDSVGEA